MRANSVSRTDGDSALTANYIILYNYADKCNTASKNTGLGRKHWNRRNNQYRSEAVARVYTPQSDSFGLCGNSQKGRKKFFNTLFHMHNRLAMYVTAKYAALARIFNWHARSVTETREYTVRCR